MFWLGSGRVKALHTVNNKGPPINFERRAGSGAAGDRKVNGFYLKSFRKASIFSTGPGREQPGIEKSTVFD